MADDDNNPDDEPAKKRDALMEALARDPRFTLIKSSGKAFVIGAGGFKPPAKKPEPPAEIKRPREDA